MSRFYEGDKPCPGCGRTGRQVARISKDDLCDDCKTALKIGKTIIKERELQRDLYRIPELKRAQISWYAVPIKEIEFSLKKLLESFSRFDSRFASYNTEFFGRPEYSCGQHNFVLPTVTYESAKELTENIIRFCNQLNEEKRTYKKELDEQLAEQKNEIFNAGVAKGRNLLLQLNRGEVTLEEFNKPIKEY